MNNVRVQAKKNSWRLTQYERLQFQGLTRVILLCNQRCIEKKTASDQIRISSENKVVKFKVLQPDLINIFLATQFLFHYILYYFLLSKSLQSLAFHLLQRNLEQLFLCQKKNFFQRQLLYILLWINLQFQNVILFPNCSRVREKLWKFEAEG